MRNKRKKWLAVLLAAAFALQTAALGAESTVPAEHQVIAVGLAFGDNALPTARIESAGGDGFRLGTMDEFGVFTELAVTTQKKITLQIPTDVNSPTAISVVATETGEALFFHNDSRPLVVRPVVVGGASAVTICRLGGKKDYQYKGDFRYERIGGGNLTVVNLIGLEDYMKGVIPYEMSPSWPIEALKAQAVCARNYTMCNLGRHKKDHFDLCAATDCQVYYGTGDATEKTDRAVEETRGEYVWYNGELASTFYFSCDGGATEDVKNVWVSDLPYLKGKVDPYEPTVMQGNPLYGWSVTFTKEELRQKVVSRGYTNCGEITNLYVAKTTTLGNVYTITVEDANGAHYSFSKDSARTMLGVKSLRFQISAAGTGGTGYAVNGTGVLPTLEGVYTIGGGGEKTAISGAPYAITAEGTAPLAATVQTVPGTYTVTGSGWGHQVGMSQWGAYAMAQQGLTYRDILNFYFTGIEIK